LPGIDVGQLYGYRVGRVGTLRGSPLDERKVLLDPYVRAIVRPANYSRVSASTLGDSFDTALKSVVTDVSRYDWEGDEPLGRPFSGTVVYELHVADYQASEFRC
jgi:isoamylase